METKFQQFLEKSNLSKSTVLSYVWTINHFTKQYETVKRENLLIYKGFLIEKFKPKTVNLRLQALNKYLEFTGKGHLKLKFVKVQQKNFLENVVSNADYKFLKSKLKSGGYTEWYFVVWFLAATGARISELLQIKAEHIETGYLDI
ncbi:MAG: hypothetical protein LBE79_06445 [Tannerella sp.]|jgi:integrase|nr:hypothetical protein [Tannerella sp.]